MSEESHLALIATIGVSNSDAESLSISPDSVEVAENKDKFAHRWKKGFCPNPGGRPKIALIREALHKELTKGDAQKLAGELLLLGKASGKRSKVNPAIQLAAIREIADRTEGKPIQSMIVQKQMDPEQMERLAELAERLAQVSR